MSDLIRIPAEGQDAELAVRLDLARRPGALVVLYLHGFGSSQDGDKANFFRRCVTGAGMSFVSLDFQGHGLSGGSMRGLSLTRCLRDVARTRCQVPQLRGAVSLAGSSMGGLVALWHAAEVLPPQVARALVLIAPALGLEETLGRTLGGDGMERWRRDGALEVTNELGTFELGWEFVADLARYTESRLAREHASPALIFQGKLDDRVSWREVAAFAKATQDRTQLELLDEGDHRLLDRLDWIWAEARKFLEFCNPGLRRAVE